MKFTSALFSVALFAVQVLAVAVIPDIEKRSLTTVEGQSPALKTRAFKSRLNCSTVPTCTTTCNALITEIQKCDFSLAGTSNVKCLCTPTFLAAALANYQCEVPVGFSNLKAVPGNNIDQTLAQGAIDTHISQCKMIGQNIGPAQVTATGPPLPPSS